MIYRINKLQVTSYKLQGREEGVTLLLAILVLSSVLAISFSLATILFIEVRSSGDLLRTEPALYAANGVGEEAIFNIKRQACPTDGSGCVYTTQFSNNVNLVSTPVQTATTTPIFQDKIPPNTTFYSANTYDFYDAVSGISSTAGSNYGKLTLTYLPTGNTGNLVVYLCEYDPTEGVDSTGQTPNTYNTTACSSPSNSVIGVGDSYWQLPNSNNFQMSPGSTQTWYFDKTLRQELILFNPATNGNNIFVSIETFGPESSPGAGDWQPKGLPYAGQTAVVINVANSSVGRKIRVIVPNTTGSIPIGFVQSATAPSNTSTPYSMTFGKNTAAGNQIIAGIIWSFAACPPSLTDTQGNTFTRVGSISQPGGSYNMFWFTAPVSSSAADTVRVTAACGHSRFSFISEYSGLSSPPYDVNVAQGNASSPCSSGSAATAKNGELIIGAFVDISSRGFTAGSGFTQRVKNSANDIMEDKIQSSAGSVAATAGCFANSTYNSYGFMAAFKP